MSHFLRVRAAGLAAMFPEEIVLFPSGSFPEDFVVESPQGIVLQTEHDVPKSSLLVLVGLANPSTRPELLLGPAPLFLP
jgi:hypothetical protein